MNANDFKDATPDQLRIYIKLAREILAKAHSEVALWRKNVEEAESLLAVKALEEMHNKHGEPHLYCGDKILLSKEVSGGIYWEGGNKPFFKEGDEAELWELEVSPTGDLTFNIKTGHMVVRWPINYKTVHDCRRLWLEKNDEKQRR